MTRFLKSACLFYHYYTDIPLPRVENFPDLCKYLGIPENLKLIIDHPGVRTVMEKCVPQRRT